MVDAATATKVLISATAVVSTGTGLLGPADEVQWVFPEIRGMTLHLQPPSGRGLHVWAAYIGPPSDGNPANGLDHLLGEPQFVVRARQMNCAISQSEDVVRLDLVFDHWEQYVYDTCRFIAFGNDQSYGDARVLGPNGRKTVPPRDKLDLMLNAMWRAETTYSRYGWKEVSLFTYGPEDFFASVGLESDLDMAQETQGRDAATPGAAVPDSDGWLDVGPGGINYWEFNAAHEPQLPRRAGFASAQDWEDNVFGRKQNLAPHVPFRGSPLENLAYAWWILGVRTHQGYNPGDRTRINKIEALRVQLRTFFDCLVHREYNYDLLWKVDTRRSMRLLGP